MDIIMCGINGMVVQKGLKRTDLQWKMIRMLFHELMIESQDRGHHATGLVSFKRDGSFETHKKPLDATKMVMTDDDYKNIVNNFSDDTSIVIAHTRYYTKGKPENNNNNHPFEIGNIIGVHNGTVANDDALFKQFEFTRNAEVDSEIVFHLLNKYNEEEITYAGLEMALEKSLLKGAFCLAFANKNFPNMVHIVKQERPMTFAFWKEAGVIIFNSDVNFINNAILRMKRINDSFDLNLTFDYDTNTLKDDTYFTINADCENIDEMIKEQKRIYILSNTTKGNWKYTPNTSCGTGTSSCNTRNITASDSIGRIIEGELNEITGEIIIFPMSVIAGVDESDDGSEMEIEECGECGEFLTDEEINASYNEHAHDTYEDNMFVCSDCYTKALNNALIVRG